MQEPPEYVGLVAQTWDLLRGDTSKWPDRAFYGRLIETYGEPVLDVGCGTGRLLLDFLGEGIDVEGVDNSTEMLDLCRAKAAGHGLQPVLHAQSMERLELSRRFRLIIVPSSSFQLILDPADADEAMRRFHHHLLPGGGLVMPFLVLGEEGEETQRAVRPDGAIVTKIARVRYDPALGVEHTDDTYEVSIDGKVVASERHLRSPATRNYGLDEARALYTRAGFRIAAVVAGFTNEPYSGEGRIFTVVGAR